jgi:hypothetical protein
MKLPEHVKQALRELRRDSRGTATLMEKQASALDASARIEPDPVLRAGIQAAVNIWPSLIAEYRAIVDKADEHLRRDDMSPAEFAALNYRANLVEAKVLALGEEIRGAAEELIRRAEPPSGPSGETR